MGASKCFANSEIHLISVSSIVSYTIRDSQGGFRKDNSSDTGNQPLSFAIEFGRTENK